MVSDKMRLSVENGSQIRAMFRAGKEMAEKVGAENVYDFSLGNPFTPVPDAFADAIRDILEQTGSTELHGYTDNEGFPEVREAIAQNLNTRFGSKYNASNILMTVGAAGALNTALKTVLNPGEEVIFLCPYFTEYRNYVANFDAVYKEVVCDETLMPDVEDLRSKITDKTKVVIINTPNNPSGVIYSDQRMRQIAAVLTEKEAEFGTDIYLISDEPYRELVYDGAVNPFIPDYYKDTLICYSFSKSLSLPGERIGYLVIPDEVSDSQMMKAAAAVANRVLGFVNAPSLIQKAVARCLDEKTDVDYYDRNRKFLYENLTKMGYTCIKPQGAFYLLVKAPIAEADFVAKAAEHHILFVGTSGFGAPGYVRIAYCTSYEKIQKSMPAFEALAKDCGL